MLTTKEILTDLIECVKATAEEEQEKIDEQKEFSILLRYRRNYRKAKAILNAEELPQKPLKLWSIRDLFELSPVDYIVNKWISERSLCEVVGAQGSGKSFLMLDMSLTIASGKKNFFGYATQEGDVFYVAAEGGHSIHYRIRAWCEENNKNQMI